MQTKLVVILAAVLLLAIVTLHTYQFHDRNFRQDEVFTVHAGQVMTLSETAQWMAFNGVHPAGWRVVAALWVKLVGPTEVATRHFATLTTLAALALIYRLAADLFDSWTALYAVLLVGTLNFTQFYMHELRPYSMLVLVTVGLVFTFLRWLKHQNLTYALLFVMLGVAGLQTHYYAGFVIAALGIVLVLLVRWRPAVYVRAAGLLVLIGVSLLAWALPLLNRWIIGSGKSYAKALNWSTLENLQDQMMIHPVAIGQFLLLLGGVLATQQLIIDVRAKRTTRHQNPPRYHPLWRFPAAWPLLALLITSGTVVAAAFALNEMIETVTPRNLIGIIPPLAIVAAVALRRLPWQTQGILLVLILVPSIRNFRPLSHSAPFRETLAFIDYQPGDRVVTHLYDQLQSTLAFSQVAAHRNHIPKTAMFHIGGSAINYPGDQIVNMVYTNTPQNLHDFATFIDQTPRIWYVHANDNAALVAPYVEQLHRDYALARAAELEDQLTFEAREYRRLPEDAADLFHFGDSISLHAWTLHDSVIVQPCQTITLDTWWQALDRPAADYGIGLVLANADGVGIARTNRLPSGFRTDKWRSGTYHVDTRALNVPCDLGPGDYPLLVGLYDYATAEALPVSLPGGAPTGTELAYLTTLIIEG